MFFLIYFIGAIPFGIFVSVFGILMNYNFTEVEFTFYTLMCSYFVLGCITFILYSVVVYLVIEIVVNLCYNAIGGTLKTENEKILDVPYLNIGISIFAIFIEVIFHFILQNYLKRKIKWLCDRITIRNNI